MKFEAKATLFRDLSPFYALFECWFLLVETATDRSSYKEFMQALVGMYRPVNVPMHWILRIQNLKNPILMSVWNMKMEFRSRNIQTGSQKKLYQERPLMCLWFLRKILSLLAARGVLEKLKRLYE